MVAVESAKARGVNLYRIFHHLYMPQSGQQCIAAEEVLSQQLDSRRASTAVNKGVVEPELGLLQLSDAVGCLCETVLIRLCLCTSAANGEGVSSTGQAASSYICPSWEGSGKAL